ncbi:hypothetical protein LPJ53_003443 [Coemansia erecta]|uniref:Uncharacterized protein n=1 Tax=Coemansia erecta TaxID=147472 RepID=A0A9W8CRZ5_9FUNG|nr:hypothetical protein LPJ53_003443 [Coemansia erecta]
MTSASSSSSSLSSNERKNERYIKRKNEKYINPTTGQVETKHAESKPKQIVESLVNKVKSTLSKDKTGEHSHQAGGVAHIHPGNNANGPMMHHGHPNAHGHPNVGMAANNPYGDNNMAAANGPMGQQMNDPMRQQVNNPMGQYPNNPVGQQMGQNQNPLGNVAMDNRAGGPY